MIAVLVIHVFPGTRGSGVNQTKAALYIYNGYIPLRTAVGKFITAALAMVPATLWVRDPSLPIGRVWLPPWDGVCAYHATACA